jgi:hypothetical protein
MPDLSASPRDATALLDAEPIIYRIDSDDRIVFVNAAWRRSAQQNGAPTLASGAVERSLWDFVEGVEVAMLWGELIARVRDGHVLSIPYRCDSGGQRRDLVMALAPLQSGGVEFASTVSRVEDRDPVGLLDAYFGDGEPLRCCSWCRRFDVGGFAEVEEAVARLGLLEQEQRPITHTICDDCAELVSDSMREAP